jgi:BirA family biotin operon repressor/biotin-[acetyl-CoA-carboxylase] ligase
MSSNNPVERELVDALRGLPLGGLRFFPTIGSTNDEALAWAAEGAKDSSIVVADEQTAGRGRMGRRWLTPAGSALAFSLILCPRGREREAVGLFSGLGPLALVDALRVYGIAAQIKWPNDVLIRGKKAAGILVETVWMGMEVDSVVLGMGVNVAPASVPPVEGLNFPATCIHAEMQDTIPRFHLLKTLLKALFTRRASIASDAFLHDWETSLAFLGETVRVWAGETAEPVIGQVEGLEADGSLRVRESGGETRVIRFGEVQLRPL